MVVKAQAKSKKKPAKSGTSATRSARPAARKAAPRSRSAGSPAVKKTAPAKRVAAKPKAKSTTKPSAARRPPKAKSTRSPATPQASAKRPAPSKANEFNLGKLGQVALTATDLDAAVAFYSNVLGLRLIARFDPPGLAFFDLGGGVRLLVSATASAASLYFNVSDLPATVRKLKRRGVTFLQKPAMIHRDEAGEFGKKGVEEWMAFFNDPSGNLLALVERR